VSRFIELHLRPKMGETDPKSLWVHVDDVRTMERTDDDQYTVVGVPGVFPVYAVETPAEIMALIQTAEQGYVEPEECRLHQCSYYTHYLVYGGPDLTHEGFHEAERQAEEHAKYCSRIQRGPCPTCARWEQRVRA